MQLTLQVPYSSATSDNSAELRQIYNFTGVKLYYYYYTAGLKQYFVNTKSLQKQNTRDHLAQTLGNGDPIYEVCVAHRTPRAWNSKGEIR